MKKLTDDKRIALTRKTIIFFFLIGILLSFKLWISKRDFPLAPVVDGFRTLLFPFDYILAFLLILGLGWSFFDNRKPVNIFVISILTFLFLQDQNRWQPWAYIYFLSLILFALPGKINNNQNNLLTCSRIIMIGIYFWSGIHKLNLNFLDVTYENILREFFGFKDVTFINSIKPLGYVIPLTEICIGIFLCFPKLRNAAVYMAIASHLFILGYLSPLGINSNSIVFPWNVAMIVIVFILFYKTTDKLELKQKLKHNFRIPVIIILTWILPALNFFGLWDNYLSFSLYADKGDEYYIVIAEGQLNKIDKDLSQYYLPADGLQGGQIINLGKWSMQELNVPFYPERRTFKKVAKSFCKFGIEEDKLYFLELAPPLSKGKVTRFTCGSLDE